ncbi:MAG: addiction module protein [Lentisphaerae bacterium RIFOXYB12_FULL_65_16]|nr:MAG: addiction module protein [Lentisphaerae bacterium RIFOXYA12_64_32]OGV85332.1 MAG: addiction module protein [Lentisphaerae bacterium RIFOXYB12_FULL_65_16]
MKATLSKVRETVRELPDVERLSLVDTILADLDRPGPEIDGVWAKEVRERRAAYRTGRLASRPFAEVMARYRKS